MALKNVKADLMGLQACLDVLDAAQNEKQASAFVAAVVADWDGGVSPATIQLALDQLAERIKDLEP